MSRPIVATPIPNEAFELEQFLQSMGFSRHSTSTGPGFGDQMIQYGWDRFRVRLVRDRGGWFVEVNDSVAPNEWYDMALLRDALGKSGPDVLSLQEQSTLLMNDWHALKALFSEERAPITHNQLDRLRRQRAKRMFPEWYS